MQCILGYGTEIIHKNRLFVHNVGREGGQREGREREGRCVAMAEDGSDALLRGWSARVEELVDQQDHDGAVNLLEEVISKLSLGDNAASNLGLAAALQDLGGLYASEGLSLRADSLLSSSLVIRQRAQKQDSSAAGDQHPPPELRNMH